MTDAAPISAEFAAVLTDSQSNIYAYIVSLVGNTDIAQDILQETNRVLIVKSAEFELGTNFIAWAFQIARFQVLQARERRGRRCEILFDEQLIEQYAIDAENHARRAETQLRALRHCLDRLDPRARAVVEIRYLRSQAVGSIASKFKLSPNAVSQVLHRARVALMRCVKARMLDEEASA
jgi:RNA polymerase sigma-70 factor (ECF subfamily)